VLTNYSRDSTVQYSMGVTSASSSNETGASIGLAVNVHRDFEVVGNRPGRGFVRHETPDLLGLTIEPHKQAINEASYAASIFTKNQANSTRILILED